MYSKRNYFIVFLYIFGLLFITTWIWNIMQGELPLVDQWTRNLVAKVDGTPIYIFFTWVTKLGSKSFVLPMTIIMAIVLIIIYRHIVPGLIFGLGTLASHLLNHGVKLLVERERPSISIDLDAVGFSFPSGHAMTSIVCYGLLAYFLAKKCKNMKVALFVQIVFAFLVCMVGISRYFINVHYLTDVLTGFMLGYMLLLILIFLYRFMERLRHPS